MKRLSREYKKGYRAKYLMLVMLLGCLSAMSHAAQPVTVDSLLASVHSGEAGLFLGKAAQFTQTDSEDENATAIAMLGLGYFTSSDCSGVVAGRYTTPSTGSPPAFPISVGASFSLVAESVWHGGAAERANVPDMTAIHSVSITFFGATSGLPQSGFPGSSPTSGFACLPVSCSSDKCTGSSTNSFILKTTAAVGDLAGSGAIYRIDGGKAYVMSLANVASNQYWGPYGQNVPTSFDNTFNATSAPLDNTYGVLAGDSYPAAKDCRNYHAIGDSNSAWFLPALNEWQNNITPSMATMNTNAPTTGFTPIPDYQSYWSSTQANANLAYLWYFDDSGSSGNWFGVSKASPYYFVRCVRALTI